MACCSYGVGGALHQTLTDVGESFLVISRRPDRAEDTTVPLNTVDVRLEVCTARDIDRNPTDVAHLHLLVGLSAPGGTKPQPSPRE